MNTGNWSRAKELFDRTIDLDAAAAQQFIEAACADDRELRDLVLGMLRADRMQDDLLDHGVEDVAVGVLGSVPPGTRIGPYEVVRPIARGGMGEVVLARRADGAFQREVAIKLLRTGPVDGEFVGRFLRERHTLARLDHEHIAALIDGGQAEDGRPYLVMELVRGSTILEFCDTRRWSIEARLRLFLKVCAAVQHAHDRAVIHRDLKPSNILVRESDGEPRLVDFGIAHLAQDRDRSDATVRTRPGGRLFTPEYASPEQVRGETITPATDVYSLGVVLYELLTGHRPYERAGSSLHELEVAICELDPERPSTVTTRSAAEGTSEVARISAAREIDPAGLRRALEGDLDVIVLKALRKEPEHRYESVAALAEDLLRHLDGRPIRARREALLGRGLRYARRHRARVAAYGLAVLLLVIVVVGFAWIHESEVSSRGDRLDAARRTLESGVVLREEGKPREAEQHLRSALAILDRIGERGDLRAEAEFQLAVAMFHDDRFEEAESLCRRALAEVTASDESSRRLRGSILNGLAWVLRSSGQVELARATAEEALEWNREHYRPGAAELVNSLQEAASHRSLRGDLDGAIALLEEAATDLRAVGRDTDPNLATTLAELGIARDRQGRYREAAELHEQAREILTRYHGETHPEVMSVTQSLGVSLYRLGRFAEAIRWLERLVDLRAARFGEDHVDVAVAAMNLGYAQLASGDAEGALRSSRRALSIREKVLAEGDSETADACLLAAEAASRLKATEPAEALLRRFLALVPAPDPERVGAVAYASALLGGILFQRREFAEAERLLLAAWRTPEGTRYAREARAKARELLVTLYAETGRPEEAERIRADDGH